MGIMVENMKIFTDSLRASTKERANDLQAIKKATEECLDGTRGFMAQIGEAHREMAAELRSTLAANRHAHLEKVAAMRGHNQQQIARTRGELRKSLGREVRGLRKSVSTFRAHCKKEQHHLAGELRQVARIWAKTHHHAV